jgi:hypothetical protein
MYVIPAPASHGRAMITPEKGSLRKDVYTRLEREDPVQWKRLCGCAVTHCVFGEGTISSVKMPDWSNPVHLSVKFGLQERTFSLSSFGDHTKFSAHHLPDQLTEALQHAEQEIAREEMRLATDLRRREDEAGAAVLRRKEQEATVAASKRQADAQLEANRVEEVEARFSDLCARVEHDDHLNVAEVKLLVERHRHALLLGYYERYYRRTNDYRALVRASTAWREAQEPGYALRVTALLLDSIERRSGSAQAAILTARGGAFLDIGRLDDAKNCALNAVDLDDKSPNSVQLLGVIHLASGDVTQGAQLFARARQLAGTAAVGRFEKAQRAAITKILQSLDPPRRTIFVKDLVRTDPPRFNWVEAYQR